MSSLIGSCMIAKGARMVSSMEARRMPRDLNLSRVALTIVTGAPGSGKSTFVAERAGAKDLIICLDTIRAGIQTADGPLRGQAGLTEVLDVRNSLLSSLATDDTHEAAWFIVSAPDAAERAHWHKMLGGEMVVLKTPLYECRRRICSDLARIHDRRGRVAAAEAWWSANWWLADDRGPMIY